MSDDLQMLGHVAAFRERGLSEPHDDCHWCQEAAERGLWDVPLTRYRVTFYYEAEVYVSALTAESATDRARLKAEPEVVETDVRRVAAIEAARRGDWGPAIDDYFAAR